MIIKRMREEFTLQTQQVLAERAGLRCSCDGCDQPTSGPRSDSDQSINVGVAAHITAASPGGPRYEPSLTTEQRRAPTNGNRLCQECASLVDNDEARYPADLLGNWRVEGEPRALARLTKVNSELSGDVPFVRLESLIREILAEMATDLKAHPLVCEVVWLRGGGDARARKTNSTTTTNATLGSTASRASCRPRVDLRKTLTASRCREAGRLPQNSLSLSAKSPPHSLQRMQMVVALLPREGPRIQKQSAS